MRDHRTLHAWQCARDTCRFSLRLCRDCWRPDSAALFRQLQRSALSIQLNLAEGHALAEHGRFRNHVTIAYGSTVETREILELLKDERLTDSPVLSEALVACRRTEMILVGLLKPLRPL
jgi:four helix bundle protein